MLNGFVGFRSCFLFVQYVPFECFAVWNCLFELCLPKYVTGCFFFLSRFFEYFVTSHMAIANLANNWKSKLISNKEKNPLNRLDHCHQIFVLNQQQKTSAPLKIYSFHSSANRQYDSLLCKYTNAIANQIDVNHIICK